MIKTTTRIFVGMATASLLITSSPFAAQQRFPQTFAGGRYAALRPIVYETLGGSVAVLSQETATPFDRRDMSMTTLCRLRKSSRTCAVSATLLDRNR